MNLKSVIFLFCALLAFVNAKDCPNVKRINSKLICYYSKTKDVDSCYCTHVILPANTDVTEIENLRRKLTGVKILFTVNEFNQGLVKTVKQNNIDGLELNLKKLSSKEDITEFISTVRTKFGNDLFLALSIPPKSELLVKYYDLKALTKTTDLFILQTAFLGASKNVTFHPSRLSGLWDMQNTDSVVDLVTGLGAPLSRLAVTAPVQAFQFRLQDSEMTTPGSPALELKTISRKELCDRMNSEQEQSWTLERDQDQAGPYIFRGKDWISFEDTTSMDIKAKYTRVRGLAGLALKDLSQDITTTNNGESTTCSSLVVAAHAGLSKQNRAPRGAVLRSLEREILETPGVGHPLEKVNVSPFRITRVVDVEGHVHSVRKDTRTEFICSRQGYFVHPQSCGRFYRCVKFDQLTDEFSVFEFDCPAGLAFDERVEVCVWPGSLPHGTACQGSSEIAPVPRGRFKCPTQPGYYVDPENCRWFFACLDHGQSEMTAYEFRCPFGLVFDEVHLLCQWPWLVPSCANGHISGLELDSIEYFGGAAKSTLIESHQGQGHLNVHLTSGAQILNSYDGLGSLGTVALGGYQGDINTLKNSLASQNLGLVNVHLHQGLASGNNGQYLTGLGGQSGEYISGYGNEGNAQNLHLIQHSVNDGTSKLAHGALLTNIGQGSLDGSLTGKGSGATSYSHYEGLNQGSAIGNQENIGLIHTNIKSSDSGVGLNLEGQNIGSQSKIGVIHFGSGISGDNSGLGLSSGHSSNIQLGLLGEGKQQETVLTSNFGSDLNSGEYSNSGYGQTGTLIDSGLSSGHSSNIQFGLLGEGKQQESVLTSNFGSKLNSGEYSNSGYGQTGTLIDSGLSSGHSSNIQLGLLGEGKQQESVLTSNFGSKLNSGEYSNSGYGQSGSLIDSGLSSGHSSNIQLGLLGEGKQQESVLTSNFGSKLNSGEYSNSGYGQKGSLIDSGLSSGHSSNIQHGLTGSQINLGLLGEGKQQESLLTFHGTTNLNSNFGSKLSSGYEQSGIQSGHATSSVEFSNFNKGNQGTILLDGGLKSGQSSVTYQGGNDKLLLPNLQVPVQQTVLLDSGIKSNNYVSTHDNNAQLTLSNNAQSTSSDVQYYGNQGNAEQKTVLLNTGNRYLTNNGGKSATSFQTTQHSIQGGKLQKVPVQSTVQLGEGQYGTLNYGYQYGNEGKYIDQPIISQTTSYGTNLGFDKLSVPTSISYGNKLTHNVGLTGGNLYGENNLKEVNYATNYYGVTPKSDIFTNLKSATYQYQTPVVQYEQKVQQPIIYEQKVQPVILKTASDGLKSHSYSQTHHYQTPVVQYEEKVQQPIVFEQKVQQPIVFEHKIEQPIVYGQKVQPVVLKTESEGLKSHSYSQTHHYQTPVVQYEQKVQQPIVYEQKIQPVVLKSQSEGLKSQSEGLKSQSYSEIHQYQSPVVQYEEKVQQPIVFEQKVQKPIIFEQNIEQPIVYGQKVQPVVLKTESEGSKSHSYSQTHHYQTPVVQYEQNVQQPIVYEQKVQPVVLKSQSERLKSQSYSQIHQYQSPVVQYEEKVQQPILYEQKVTQPIVFEQKVQPVVLKSQSGGLKSQSYSQIHQYQTPVVQYEEKVQQPILYEQKITQPIVFEQKVQPVVLKSQSGGLKSQSYSQTHHYQSPVVQYEQKVEQPIVYEHKVQQPIIFEQKVQPVLKTESDGTKSHSYSQTHHYQSPVVQYEQKVEQPIVFEQKVQPVVLKSQSEGLKSQSYSQIHHYQSPVVQYEQKVEQPILFEQKVEQPIVYEQNVQPIVLKSQSDGLKSQSYSQTHHYESPVVQKVQQPIVYEQKVQQPIVFEQKIQPVQYEQKIQPVVYKTESEGSKSHSYSSINHYHTPAVQYQQKVEQPVVVQQSIPQQVLLHKEIKTPVVPIVETKQQSYSSGYQYQTPVVQYEQKVRPQINLYNTNIGESQYEKVEDIKFSSLPAQQIKQTAYSTSYLNHEVPVVQYEQKVQQPVVQYEQKVQPPVYKQKIEPVVYKTVSEGSKSHSYSQTHHYQNPVVQYEQKVEQPIIQQNIELKTVQQPEILLHTVQTPVQTVTVTPKYYEQKYQEVTPKYETHYQEINIPVVKQPSAFVSKVNIPVETVSVTPKYESHSYSTIKHHITAPKVDTQYYAQPIQKLKPITYEGRLPVVEPKVVQKVVQPLYNTYSQPSRGQTTYFGKKVNHIQTVTSAPQIVNTYLPVKQETREYLPPKPIVNTVYVSSTPKPQIYIQPKQVFVSTTPKYSVFQEYVQPKQTFEIKKTVQPITYQTFSTPVKTVTPAPTIVESYSYLPPKVESREYLPPVQSYLPAKKPEVYVSTTPKYAVFQDYVQPKQTFEIKKPVSPTVISEYQYENPEFAHYESKLNFNSAQDLSYEYQPKVQTETVYYSTQKPVVSTVQTIPVKSYQTDYILSSPKPNFVSTIAPIIKQTPTLRTKVVAINKYETLDNQYFVSTPKPIYISTPIPTEAPYGEFKYYDSRYDTAPKQEPNQYFKETADYSSDLYNQFGNYEYIEATPKIVTSTLRPIQRKKIVSTTQIPLDNYQEYYDDKFDSQYIPTIATTYRPQIRKNYVSTSTESYNDNNGYIITSRPAIRPVQRKKIVSTTSSIPLNNYNNDYVITTLRPRIITRPIIKQKKIVTTTTGLPIDYDEYFVSSVKPESIKITPRPKGKTIVRVNDFHPFLTTKLGAQCTCTSNTLKLRKSKQRVEIPEYDFELPDNVPVTKITSSGPASYDDYNEPGVYVVGNSDVSNNYDYEPRKIVAVTKTPDIVIKSTTNAIQPAPTPIYTIRKKVTSIRPEGSSIYDEPEIILSSTPASTVVDEVFLRNSKSKEQKIAEAVNEGLSLVKSAIKGYVKDAVNEEVRNFDRYGPGGWRSRDETLQGSVDCQRAGLFRHPTQCNKFYACHWDCKKERYTLHVFNCPVHLTFDTTQGACNWPSKGPACTDNTLLPSS